MGLHKSVKRLLKLGADSETSDKAFKAIVAVPSLSDLLYTILHHVIPSSGGIVSRPKIPLNVGLAAAQAVYVLTDTNVPTAPKFPLPRDTSLSAAHSKIRTMLLDIVRTLLTKQQDDEVKMAKAASHDAETMSTFKVLCMGILQNISQQHIAKKSEKEEEAAEFKMLALSVLTSGLENIELKVEAECAIRVHKSLPEPSATLSVEAALVSEQRLALDGVETRWTRLRLTLEILGELVAELDGILNVGLGDAEYEEWHGFSSLNGKEAEMMHEIDHEVMDGKMRQDVASDATCNPQDEARKSSHLSNDVLAVFSTLPAILLNLAQPTSLSFSSLGSRAASPKSTDASSLIPTQIEHGQHSQETHDQPKDYIPSLTELISLIHVRALECLNNLLITVGRSLAVDELTAPGAQAESAEMESLDLDGDGLHDSDGEGLDDESGDQALHMDVAGDTPAPKASDRNALDQYVSKNLATYQQIWETLFDLLVAYVMSLRGRQSLVTEADTQQRGEGDDKGQKKMSTSNAGPGEEEDACTLCMEASLGSIWSLGRLCINTLVSRRISVLQMVLFN